MPLISALLPILRTLQTVSIHPLSVNSLKNFTSKQFNFWSISSILIFTGLLIHGIIDSDFYADPQHSTITFIKLCSVRLGHIIVLIESFLQRQNLIEMIDILSRIDATLTKQLGIDVGHGGFRVMLLNLLIIGSGLFVFIEGAVLYFFLKYSNQANFLAFWIANTTSLSVICLRYLQIIVFIYIIQSRLSVINLSLSKIDGIAEKRSTFVSVIGHLEDDNRDMLKRQNKRFRHFDEVTVLGELFGKLYDAAKMINGCFGISLLVCVGNDFVNVTLNGYWMYLTFSKFFNVAVICAIGLWTVPHLMSLLLISGFCYSTVGKVST